MVDKDARLLEAWQGGDQQSGDLLVRRHFWAVYRFFRSKTDGAAEDLTQRTFLACVEAKGRVDAQLGFRAYLFGIARYQLTNYLRRLGRTHRIFAPDQHSVADLERTPPDAGVMRGDERRALLHALRRLPVDHQIAVELYYWERMPLAAIAAVIDVAEGTVKSRLGRARRTLREHLARMQVRPQSLESSLEDLEAWAARLRPPGAGPSAERRA